MSDGLPSSGPAASVDLPDRAGWWRIEHREAEPAAPTEIEVYPLDPVGGQLCVWGEDVGGVGDGPSGVWATDEWLGHLPVTMLPGHFAGARYTFLRPLD